MTSRGRKMSVTMMHLTIVFIAAAFVFGAAWHDPE